MKILKIKDWIQKKPQFEIIKRDGQSPNGKITMVQRIKDGFYFDLYGNLHSDVTFQGSPANITHFYTDLLHVEIKMRDENKVGLKFFLKDGKTHTEPFDIKSDPSKAFKQIVKINEIEFSLFTNPHSSVRHYENPEDKGMASK